MNFFSLNVILLKNKKIKIAYFFLYINNHFCLKQKKLSVTHHAALINLLLSSQGP